MQEQAYNIIVYNTTNKFNLKIVLEDVEECYYTLYINTSQTLLKLEI